MLLEWEERIAGQERREFLMPGGGQGQKSRGSFVVNYLSSEFMKTHCLD